MPFSVLYTDKEWAAAAAEWEELKKCQMSGKKVAAAAARKRERAEVARKAAAYDELVQQHQRLLYLLQRNEIDIRDLKCPADSDYEKYSDDSDSSSEDDEPLSKIAKRLVNQ